MHEDRHRGRPPQADGAIEVIDNHEQVLATGRCTTDNAGYAAMRKHVAAWPERTWAGEGSNGRGRASGAAATRDQAVPAGERRLLVDGASCGDLDGHSGAGSPTAGQLQRPSDELSTFAHADQPELAGGGQLVQVLRDSNHIRRR